MLMIMLVALRNYEEHLVRRELTRCFFPGKRKRKTRGKYKEGNVPRRRKKGRSSSFAGVDCVRLPAIPPHRNAANGTLRLLLRAPPGSPRFLRARARSATTPPSPCPPFCFLLLLCSSKSKRSALISAVVARLHCFLPSL